VSQFVISILQSICFSIWQQVSTSTAQHGMLQVSIANKGAIVLPKNKTTNSIDKVFFILRVYFTLESVNVPSYILLNKFAKINNFNLIILLFEHIFK